MRRAMGIEMPQRWAFGHLCARRSCRWSLRAHGISARRPARIRDGQAIETPAVSHQGAQRSVMPNQPTAVVRLYPVATFSIPVRRTAQPRAHASNHQDLQQEPEGLWRSFALGTHGVVKAHPLRYAQVTKITIYHPHAEASMTPANPRKKRRSVSRTQTGVRLESRLLKVLKALAEYHDITLGDLLEGICLHTFEGKVPFSDKSLSVIADLQRVYGLDLTAADSHLLVEPKEGPE